MEVQIKKAIKAGNSSAVILPRAWLNKEVRVELLKKTEDIILEESLKILKKHISLSNVIGIYLVGSYARGEEIEGESDVDILVISDNIDRETIYDGIYNVLIISKALLNQKLEDDLFPIGQMLKEAKPLLNSNYLKDLNIKVTKKNVRWYINSTEDKLKLIKEFLNIKINKNSKYIEDRVAYTLVLRIRTLEIIKKIIQNESYSKKEFIKLIKNVSGSGEAYERYLVVKRNQKEENNKMKTEETEKLYNYLDNVLEMVKGII